MASSERLVGRLLTIAFVCGRFQAVSVDCCVTISCSQRIDRYSTHQSCDRMGFMGGSLVLVPQRLCHLL